MGKPDVRIIAFLLDVMSLSDIGLSSFMLALVEWESRFEITDSGCGIWNVDVGFEFEVTQKQFKCTPKSAENFDSNSNEEYSFLN